jgi:predicted ATPase
MYNHKTKLYMTAEKPLAELFVISQHGEISDEVFALDRCKSRLSEMQTEKYMAEPSYFKSLGEFN